MHIFLKGNRKNFNIETTLFLSCKQMFNYKLNLLSRIEYKY